MVVFGHSFARWAATGFTRSLPMTLGLVPAWWTFAVTHPACRPTLLVPLCAPSDPYHLDKCNIGEACSQDMQQSDVAIIMQQHYTGKCNKDVLKGQNTKYATQSGNTQCQAK